MTEQRERFPGGVVGTEAKAGSPVASSPGTLSRAVKRLPHGLAAQKPTEWRAETAGAVAVAVPATPWWNELKEQAAFAFESGLLPRSIDSRQKAITIALMGRELGLTPMQALCGIYVVNGMTALRGSLMLRLIYERVPGSRLTVLTSPDQANQECAVEMQRPHGKPQIFRYTIEDARKAGFLNKPIWQQHTSTMLRWAAIRTGARVVFADAIAGCYMEDELPHAKTVAIEGAQPDEPVVPTANAPQAAPAVEAEEVSSSVASATAPVEESVGPKAPEAEAVVTAKVAVEPVAEVPYVAPAAPERRLVRDLPVIKRVTEKQIHRLYAIAHEKNWNRQDVGVWMEKWFHKREAKDLNRTEYDRLCNFLLSSPGKSTAMKG